MVFITWLIFFCVGLPARIQTIKQELSITKSMDDEQKRTLLYGDFYKFIQSCKAQIPENAVVFLVSDSIFEYYYGSYYLYPRKVLVNEPDKKIDGLSNNKPVNLTEEFCLKNNISYVIVPRLSKIVKVK